MTYRTASWVGISVLALSLALPREASAQATAIAPYFMLVVDNSGSMSASTGCSTLVTMATCTGRTGCSWNAGAAQCDASQCAAPATMAACTAVAGCTWTGARCSGDGVDSCGQPHTRINDARCVMQQVVNAYGDVQFGLMRYSETVTGTCGAPAVASLNCGGCANSGAGCPAAGPLASQGQLLAPIVAHGAMSVEQWADFVCATGFDSVAAGANPELRPDTWTPIAGTVRGTRSYYEGTGLYATLAGDACAGHGTMATCNADVANNCGWSAGPAACRIRSPLTASLIDQTCRPVSLVFLTDGEETCASDAATLAAIDELYGSTAAGVAPRHILSYFIGFGMTPPDAYIENFAQHGGTDAPGAFRGFYATDDTSLALAFSQIIANSILVEVCDRMDNDCDMAVDEGFTLYCDRYCTGPEACTLPAGHPAQDLCTIAPETRCDGIDDNCNGQIDEGLRNACGTCGAAPLEVCNNLDDDCDIAIDEGVCGGCVPSVEICDNLDNDCNGVIDNITRPCGIMVGVCTTGTQLCTAGTWGTCSGTGPTAEICDGLDNDCDGAIDGQVQACGSMVGACRPGSQICTMGTLGPCVGAVGPTPERCDLIDNNCNGMTDEGDPGGGGVCGSAIGVCTAGIYHCVAGALACTGGSMGSAEICNNIDDDCDGSIDEGIASSGPCPGGSSVGVCRTGTLLCTGGSFMCVGRVDPMPELCDNLDNNCNGTIDEGNPEGGVMCGVDTGACMSGTTQCMGGVLSCVGAIGPSPEVCNAIDDDCNGVVDDGIPVGAPCGTSTGECTPGVFVCNPVTGMLVCQGGISGVTEVCDTLDNDCDGAIDEDVGAGGTCGSMVGDCMQGTNRCVGGAIMCVGEVPPTTEICDCHDNNCNGAVDEPPPSGSLCPAGSACVMCQCASACQHTEFGDRCPDGTTPFLHDGVCSCVAPACDAATCGGQTLMDTAGNVECAPTSATGTTGPCVCRNNACTFACEGVTCAGALTCNPRTGACVENNCRGLGCATGQICDGTSGACVSDPCVAVTCPSDQACRAGTCEATCAAVTCPSGERCHAGVCSHCIGVTCATGRVCDPSSPTGACVLNMCLGITCPGTQTCNTVTGICHGDPCEGLHCPTMTACQAGECVRMVAPTDAGPNHDAGSMPGVDSGTSRTDSGTMTRDDRHRVLASGGGPICSVDAQRRDAGGGTRAWLALLLLGGVVARRRQRRGGSR